ncbi:permease prefix domain 1-containing protein [Amycolatopsis pittospori]|uniref:permease prefix domain 1-containing protein n=1 Tax=Amycolatopsis pittospori TaxID=2749434 RepID=UPI0015F03A33|nr:permease prefix domain 1-containing protein [Amycolatopsis pittospori]
MSAIEAYVSDLDRRLSGSAGAKADLLTEARDGLRDAAEAYREGGAGELEAELKAVADFGPAPEIASAYQQELALRGDIGTLWKVIVGVPLFQLSWELARIWTYGGWDKMGKPTPEWYLSVVDLSGVFVVVSPVIGVAALLGTRWLGRRLDGGRLGKVTRWTVGAAAIANLVAMLLLAVGTVVLDPARMNMSLLCNVLAVGWAAFSFWLVPLAFRSWRPRALVAA